MEQLGTLFTNERHRIIYIDEMLQQVMGINNKQTAHLLGNPVAQLLGFSQSTYEDLVKDVIDANDSVEIPMTLALNRGAELAIVADAIANKNHQSTFMGIDYIFYGDPTVLPAPAPSVPKDIENELIRLYCQGQINALIKYLEMMGGQRMSDYIKESARATAEKQDWGLVEDKDGLRFSDSNSPEANRGLLHKATSYSYKLLGKSVIASHLENNNQNFSSSTFDFIDANWHQKI